MRMNPLESPAGKNRRLLIIDDNRAIHDDFLKILAPPNVAAAALEAAEAELFGQPTGGSHQIRYEIDSAYQGAEGLKLVEQALAAGRPYAMAFVDIRMPPGWDGLETTREIWKADPEVQIVLCTAYADYSWEEMFAQFGLRDGLVILKKPFDSVEVLQLALALTEKWGLHQQSRNKMELLEQRVMARTAELQASNRALQTEIAEHRRVREELEWKTAFLEAQVHSAPDGILVVNPDGRKILQNQRTTDLFKIPRAIVVGNDDAEQVRWVANQTKDPEQFAARVHHLYRHPDEIAHDEIELTDGTVLDRYSASVVGPAGKNYGRIWTFRDITERRRIETALRESEARFAGAFAHAPIGVALLSPTGHWLQVNRSLCELVGYTEADLLAQTFQEITPPEDLAVDREISRRLLAGEIAAYQTEKHYIHRRGHRVTVQLNVSLVRDESGRPQYFIAQIQDITERNRVEEELRLLGLAVEQSKDSIVITEAELNLPGPKIIFVNPAFTRMTGYTAAEALGKTPRMLQGPHTDKTVLRRLRLNLERGETFEGEVINYRKDGREYDQEWQIVPLRQASGKITHFVATQRDITGRKRVEAQLVQSQKMETVGKLAGGIAHEFNSLLTAIIGQSELLAGQLPAGGAQARSVTEIRQAAGRATSLTRQLLAYGRKQLLHPESLDLNQVIENMAGIFHHLMGSGIEIQLVTAPRLQAVLADAGQIEQVIVNLAINARDAMPNGGKLTLETANVTLDQAYVARFPEFEMVAGEYVFLAISDTGVGMNAEVKAHLFEPFFTTKGIGLGTGLGLSTCYGIIKQSGGQVSVYSETGRGTTFRIYLPQIVAPPPKPVSPRQETSTLPGGTETILLVEEDPALREMAVTLLRRLGYTVLAAAHGIEALSLKLRPELGPIDLLFTDVTLPHMSGSDLAERVRAIYPHARLLFTSAYTEHAIVRQGAFLKGVALLQKPFTPSALAHKLREVLGPTRGPAADPAQITFSFP